MHTKSASPVQKRKREKRHPRKLILHASIAINQDRGQYELS